MTPADDLRQHLDELRPIYEAVQKLRGRREELQTVEAADRAYRELLAAETAAVTELRRRRDDLEREWLRRSARPDLTEDESATWEPAWKPPAWTGQPPRPAAPPPEQRAASAGQVRRRLGRLILQYQYVWQLESALLGQVNCIVADEDRPLGEALALLPWRAFAEPGRESPMAHRQRLADWRAALDSYRDQLEGAIDILETQLRGCLGIWELWRRREQQDGRPPWDRFIEESRRALREEATRLRQEVLGLEARLGTAGGQP
jgi:hypothetical protein